MKCPACGHENLPGAEDCDACGWDLLHNELPPDASTVQQSIIRDTIEHLYPYRSVTVEVGDSVGKAIDVMREHRFGCVMITDGGKLVGIFTERDFLYRVANQITDLESVPIEKIMTPNPGVVRSGDTFAKALNLMAMHRYRHIPVVDDHDAPTGFLSSKGIFRYLCEHALDEN